MIARCASAVAGFSMFAMIAACSGASAEGEVGSEEGAIKSKAPTASAEIHRACKLSRLLDDGVLEESFSQDEPDVTVDRNSKGEVDVSIGGSSFSSGDKDTILRVTKSTATDVEVQMDQMADGINAKPGGKIAQTITVAMTGSTGALTVTEPGAKGKKFATLKCSPE
jgi:hypothetical protein